MYEIIIIIIIIKHYGYLSKVIKKKKQTNRSLNYLFNTLLFLIKICIYKQ
jgi:hypothetical protein